MHLTFSLLCLLLACAGAARALVVGMFVLPHGDVVLDPGAFTSDSPSARELAWALHYACQNISEEVVRLHPDIVLLTTPHGVADSDRYVLYQNPTAAGVVDTSAGNPVRVATQLDTVVTSAILRTFRHGSALPVSGLSAFGPPGQASEPFPLQWGEVIPLSFLQAMLLSAASPVVLEGREKAHEDEDGQPVVDKQGPVQQLRPSEKAQRSPQHAFSLQQRMEVLTLPVQQHQQHQQEQEPQDQQLQQQQRYQQQQDHDQQQLQQQLPPKGSASLGSQLHLEPILVDGDGRTAGVVSFAQLRGAMAMLPAKTCSALKDASRALMSLTRHVLASLGVHAFGSERDAKLTDASATTSSTNLEDCQHGPGSASSCHGQARQDISALGRHIALPLAADLTADPLAADLTADPLAADDSPGASAKTHHARAVILSMPSRRYEAVVEMIPELLHLGAEAYKFLHALSLRVVVVASADLAHTHRQDGPYGYSDTAAEFDGHVRRWVEGSAGGAPLLIDAATVVDSALSCGFAGLVMMQAMRQASAAAGGGGSSPSGALPAGRVLAFGNTSYYGMMVAAFPGSV